MILKVLSRLLVFLILGCAAFQSFAQQNEADRKALADLIANAQKGGAQAQFELGNTFYFGRLNVAKDSAEAVKWYRKAAEQGFAPAEYRLGYSYEIGSGVARDYSEAV